MVIIALNNFMISKLSLLLLLGYVSADVNEDFEGILFGKYQPREYDLQRMFKQHQLEFHNKETDSLTNSQAYDNFKATVKTIIDHNSNEERTFDMGLNTYSDMASNEFLDHYTWHPWHPPANHCYAHEQGNSDVMNEYEFEEGQVDWHKLPRNFDWRDYGDVSPVKD